MLFVKLYILLSICLSIPISTDYGERSTDYLPFKAYSQANRYDRRIAVAGSIISSFIPFILIGPAVIPEMAGAILAGMVNTATIVFLTRNNIGDAERYQKLFGKIEIHINSALADKSAAVMRARLRTISSNLFGQSNAYLAEVGIVNGVLMENATAISPHKVDISMKSIDNIMTGANSVVFNGKINSSHPDEFVLMKKSKKGLTKCLHTLDFNFTPGTQLLFDDQCAMNSLHDKLFATGDNKNLLFYSPVGKMCVSMSRFGHLAVYSIDSPECQKTSRITIRPTKAGNFAIYNGTSPACLNYIKGKGTYYPGLSIGKKCANVDPITFDTRIPVPVTPGSLYPAQSFDEIAVQINYFQVLVSMHLAALKEMYLYGSMKRFAENQFKSKAKQYLIWISSYLPVFQQYIGLMGYNATEEIMNLKRYQEQLKMANLKPTVIHFSVNN